MSADNGLWYVKTPDGDVNPMSLDDLDEAFNAGRIDENVMVLPAGEARWARLGALLGPDEPAPPTPPSRAVLFAAAAPNSLRPVSLDLGDLGDTLAADPFRRKSRRGVLAGAIVGVLALGGVAFTATRGHVEPAHAAAAVAVAPPPVAAPAPPPPPAEAAPPPASTTRFSEEQKSKLSAADRALEAKVKAHKKDRAAPARPQSKYKTQGFTSGGSKYDPLNAN